MKLGHLLIITSVATACAQIQPTKTDAKRELASAEKNLNCKILLKDFDKVKDVDFDQDEKLLAELLKKKGYTLTSESSDAEFILRNNQPEERVPGLKGGYLRGTTWEMTSRNNESQNFMRLKTDHTRMIFLTERTHKQVYENAAELLGDCTKSREAFYKHRKGDAKGEVRIPYYNYTLELTSDIKIPETFYVPVSTWNGLRSEIAFTPAINEGKDPVASCDLFVRDTSKKATVVKKGTKFHFKEILNQGLNLQSDDGLEANIYCNYNSREEGERNPYANIFYDLNVHGAINAFSQELKYSPQGEQITLKKDISSGEEIVFKNTLKKNPNYKPLTCSIILKSLEKESVKASKGTVFNNIYPKSKSKSYGFVSFTNEKMNLMVSCKRNAGELGSYPSAEEILKLSAEYIQE